MHLEHHIEPLKEGEKIKVNIKAKGTSSNRSTAGGSSGFSGLKPPPQPGATVFGSILPPMVSETSSSAETPQPSGEDDDWGDFVSTNP
jgi:hypothetical protein